MSIKQILKLIGFIIYKENKYPNFEQHLAIPVAAYIANFDPCLGSAGPCLGPPGPCLGSLGPCH